MENKLVIEIEEMLCEDVRSGRVCGINQWCMVISFFARIYDSVIYRKQSLPTTEPQILGSTGLQWK